MHTEEKPPAYGHLVTIQPPPPPYIAPESEYSPYPLLNTGQFLAYSTPSPQSTLHHRYSNQRLGPSRFRSIFSSWRSVIYEARWTFLGCCSCILVMLVIIVTIFAYAPQLHSAHFHKL